MWIRFKYFYKTYFKSQPWTKHRPEMSDLFNHQISFSKVVYLIQLNNFNLDIIPLGSPPVKISCKTIANNTKGDRRSYKSNLTHMSIVLILMKSQCSGFSTSTTPQGYSLPLILLPRTSISWLEPTTAKGTAA